MKLRSFMELRDVLPCSEEHSTCPYFELDKSFDACSYFLKSHLNFILPFTPRSGRWSVFLKDNFIFNGNKFK